MKRIVIHKHDITPDWDGYAFTRSMVCVMRASAEILSAATQQNRICIWESHDSNDYETRDQQFLLVTTGGTTTLPEDSRFLGTVQLLPPRTNEMHVYHVYVLPPAKSHTFHPVEPQKEMVTA